MFDAGDVIRLKVYTLDTDQIGLNVVHWYCYSRLGNTQTEQSQLDAVTVEMKTAYSPLLNQNAFFIGCTMQKIAPIAGGEWFTRNANLGTSGAVALPRQSSGIMSWRANIPGRRGRGRTYVPFPSVSDNELDGKPTTTYKTNLSALRPSLVNLTVVPVLAETVSFRLIIYHRATNTFDTVTSSSTGTKWATQRRRGGFGRPNVLPVPLQ